MATQAIEVPSKKPSLRERLDLGNGFTPYFLVLPTVLVILVVAVIPILYSLWLSFLNSPPGPSVEFIGLSNYVQLFASSDFRSSISTTLIFTTISVTLETIFGLGIALLLNDTFPGRGLVRASILVPWAFPTVISAQIWYLMYNDRTGIVSYLLQQMHFLAPGATLLQTNRGVIAAAIITDVWKTFGAFDLFYILGGNQVQSMASYSYNYMFTRTTFDFAPGVAAAIVLFVIVVCQIAYRFSAMIIVAKGALKFLATRQNVKAP